MKKYLFLILFFSNSLFAFNLDQALDVLEDQNIKIDKNSDLGKNIQKVTNKSVNKINKKIDHKIDKLGGKVFDKIAKYEKRISNEIDKLTNIRKSLEQAIFYLKIAAIILTLVLAVILLAVLMSYFKLRKISKKILDFS